MFVIPTRRRSPTAGVASFDQMMNEMLGGFPAMATKEAFRPATDVSEDDAAVTIVTELPGVRPEDVKLSLEAGTLTIRGEKKQESREETKHVHRYERSFGSFERRFHVPETVESEKIGATFDDGVLRVLLPKSERARTREIPVQVGVKSE